MLSAEKMVMFPNTAFSHVPRECGQYLIHDFQLQQHLLPCTILALQSSLFQVMSHLTGDVTLLTGCTLRVQLPLRQLLLHKWSSNFHCTIILLSHVADIQGHTMKGKVSSFRLPVKSSALKDYVLITQH